MFAGVARKGSSVWLWVVAGSLAVGVFGGLGALFTFGLGGGAVSPVASMSPAASVSEFSRGPDLPDLTQEQYPAELEGWTRGWADFYPVYFSSDGKTQLLITDLGAATMSLRDYVDSFQPDAVEYEPGVFCYQLVTALGERLQCTAHNARGRQIFVARSGEETLTVQELAAWCAEFIAVVPD